MGVVISARGLCHGEKVDEGWRFPAFGRVRCAVLQSLCLCLQTKLFSIHCPRGAHTEAHGPARRLCFLGSRMCSSLGPMPLEAAGEQVSSGWSSSWCPPCRGDWCRISSPRHQCRRKMPPNPPFPRPLLLSQLASWPQEASSQVKSSLGLCFPKGHPRLCPGGCWAR